MALARPRTQLSGIGYRSPKGGDVAVTGTATAIGPIRHTPHGVSFGPLELQARAESTIAIGSLQFLESELSLLSRLLPDIDILSDLGLFGSGAALVAASRADSAEGDDPDQVTRRDVLRMGAAAAGLYAVSADRARGASEPPELTFAEFGLTSNPSGMRVRLADIVSGVLPPESTYYVEVNGNTITDFGAGDDSAFIPPGLSGLVQISTDADATLWDRVQGLLADDEMVFELELEKSTAAYSTGSSVHASEDPVVTDALEHIEDDGSKAIFTIGDTSIPHKAEAEEPDLGKYYYDPERGALIYVVGADPPDSSAVTLRLHAGRIDEIRDDIDRKTHDIAERSEVFD